MISPITKEIENFSVRFRPLPATKAFTLAKRVGTVILPLIKGLDFSSPNKEIDLGEIIDGAVDALGEFDDEKAIGIIVDSLKGCTITAPGQPAVEINSSEDIDNVFQGELETMYKIIFESWKYNKLAPFKLAARFGVQMKTTDTLDEAASTGTRRGPGLAMSGVSPMK